MRSDAWLLAALTEGRPGRVVTLPELMHDADWLNRMIPTFDEVSFGLPRLVAAGYVIVSGEGKALSMRPTAKAFALRREVDRNATALVDVLTESARSVGARPYPLQEDEDRSLGRQPGLAAGDAEEAFRAYERWFWRHANPLVALARLVGRLTRR